MISETTSSISEGSKRLKIYTASASVVQPAHLLHQFLQKILWGRILQVRAPRFGFISNCFQWLGVLQRKKVLCLSEIASPDHLSKCQLKNVVFLQISLCHPVMQSHLLYLFNWCISFSCVPTHVVLNPGDKILLESKITSCAAPCVPYPICAHFVPAIHDPKPWLREVWNCFGTCQIQ